MPIIMSHFFSVENLIVSDSVTKFWDGPKIILENAEIKLTQKIITQPLKWQKYIRQLDLPGFLSFPTIFSKTLILCQCRVVENYLVITEGIYFKLGLFFSFMSKSAICKFQ